MNTDMKNLIQYVSTGNLRQAQLVAKNILENDSTAKDKIFVENTLRKIDKQLQFIELPTDVSTLLIAEDVVNTFKFNRYYFRDNELAIIEKVKNIKQVAEQLAEKDIRVLNSTLLFGESGTGKTTLAKAIAYKLEMPFVYVNFSNMISSYLGSSQKNISKVFEFIRAKECVLLMDEIDAIGMRRDSGKDVTEISRILIGLLQELDRLSNSSVIVAATNRIDMIDEALIRRFFIQKEIKRPNNIEERVMYVTKFLDDIQMGYSIEAIRKECEQDMTQSDLMNKLIEGIINSMVNAIK